MKIKIVDKEYKSHDRQDYDVLYKDTCDTKWLRGYKVRKHKNASLWDLIDDEGDVFDTYSHPSNALQEASAELIHNYFM